MHGSTCVLNAGVENGAGACGGAVPYADPRPACQTLALLSAGLRQRAGATAEVYRPAHLV